jgi:hypothetical protein
MSKKKLAVIIVGCVIVIAAIATPIATPLGPKIVTDYSSFLDYLRDSGAFIRDAGETGRGLFYDAECRIVEVGGIPIQVYEYANAKVMEAEASCVSPDGFSITKDWGDGKTSSIFVNWIGIPHFYKAGRIIVIYIGDNYSIIILLQNGLGKQFAGM